MASEKKPVLIFDGDCNFCRRWVGRWRALTGEAVAYAPAQKVGGDYPQIEPEAFAASVWLVEPDGRVSGGAEAVFRTLAHRPSRRWLLRAYETIPGFSYCAERFYALVARRRVLFSRLTRWLWGSHLEPPSYHLSRWIFLRLLGLAYLSAFASLGTQIAGLIGHDGILPADAYLAAAYRQLGAKAYHLLPTLCWLNSSDGFLKALCWSGAGLSALLILDVAPGPILAILWALYLSVVSVGRDFLSFQWDILLLEAGFLAIFLAPWRLRPRLSGDSPPSGGALFLLRWLLFRLMFESGCVKLLSGDPAWRNLTALSYHYETQPLPTALAWYAQRLPAGFQKFSVAAMFAIELGAPWLIFAPRRPRLLAFAALASLQILIAETGNYCFFNLLTLSFCLLLLDDAFLRGVSRRLSELFPQPEFRMTSRLRDALALPILLFAVSTGAIQLYGMLRGRLNLPRPVEAVLAAAEPLHLVNTYGLFAVMTTVRNEIVIQGSEDGNVWSDYRLPWKPQDVKSRPRLVAPRQPRLDWQMWFAALSPYQDNPWFLNLLARLIQGKPEVLALFAGNPFPNGPPRYLRAEFYEYHFTDWAERRKTGAWWRRQYRGLYCPVVSARGG